MRKKLISENLDKVGIPLEEMANAIQKYTGLPGVIYFCTKSELSNQQAHSLGRVKWRNAGKEAYLTIKTDKNGKRLSIGDPRMTADLERFIVKNENVLWEYWNTPSDIADSAETMKKFQPI